jgi:hypothetical protein
MDRREILDLDQSRAHDTRAQIDARMAWIASLRVCGFPQKNLFCRDGRGRTRYDEVRVATEVRRRSQGIEG